MIFLALLICQHSPFFFFNVGHTSWLKEEVCVTADDFCFYSVINQRQKTQKSFYLVNLRKRPWLLTMVRFRLGKRNLPLPLGWFSSALVQVAPLVWFEHIRLTNREWHRENVNCCDENRSVAARLTHPPLPRLCTAWWPFTVICITFSDENRSSVGRRNQAAETESLSSCVCICFLWF